MDKKFFIASIAVFVVWAVLDFIMHGVVLAAAYEETEAIWRDEPKVVLIYLVTLISAGAFVYVYSQFINPKNTGNAVKYGLVFSIGAGTAFAYGTYSVIDVPYNMALIWFLGTIVEGLAGGYLLGMLVKADDDA